MIKLSYEKRTKHQLRLQTEIHGRQQSGNSLSKVDDFVVFEKINKEVLKNAIFAN